MRHSTILCIGLLALAGGLAALTPPSLAQTDVTAADNTYLGYYPGYPAPGAVIPPC